MNIQADSPHVVREAGYNADPDGVYLPYVGFYQGVSEDTVSAIKLALADIRDTMFIQILLSMLMFYVAVSVFSIDINTSGLVVLLVYFIPFNIIKFIKDYSAYNALYNK